MKRSNWLYRYATLTSYGKQDTIDICTLTKGLVSNTLAIALALVILAAVIGVAVLTLIGVLEIVLNLGSVGSFMLFFGSNGAMGITFLFLVILGISIWYTMEGIYKLANKEPGIVKIAYRSWKDKYCHIFKLED